MNGLKQGAYMRAFAVCLALLFCIEIGWCDDYKEVTDTAYCAGALKRNAVLVKKMSGRSGTTGDEQHLALKIAFLQGALKQNKIDIETANRLISIGEADAQLCWDTLANCSAEAARRSRQNVDLGLSKQMLENCNRPAESVCKRIEACN